VDTISCVCRVHAARSGSGTNLEFIDAYYYLIIVAYFMNYLEFKKVKSYVTKVYGLIELKA
jgi:hypothetical protein